MSETISIEIGAFRHFRYIGIKPPLTDLQHKSLVKAKLENPDLMIGFGTKKASDDERYSESCFITDSEADPVIGDERVLKAARLIQSVLTNDGNSVELHDTIKRSGTDPRLFSSIDVSNQPAN